MATLVDMAQKNDAYKSLIPYLAKLNTRKISDLTSWDLRETYFYDPNVNSTKVQRSFHLISEFDRTMATFIKENLIGKIRVANECEADHCECDQLQDNLQYSCLLWLCNECIDEHTEMFTCTGCNITQCGCQEQTSWFDRDLNKWQQSCYACEEEKDAQHWAQIMANDKKSVAHVNANCIRY